MIDTALMLKRHIDEITLAPLNSGSPGILGYS